MAHYYTEPSRTFSEYLLVPNLTSKDCNPSKVSLKTPIVKFKQGEEPEFSLNIPFSSAVMQAVSDDRMAVALARSGGISFIFGSQSVEGQAEMVRKAKGYKAGFVVSRSNLTPGHTLKDVLDLKERTGHSTVAITDDGTPTGKLLGIVTGRDYRLSRDPRVKPVSEFMTPFSKLIYGNVGLSLSEANDLIWDHKLNCLPIVDEEQKLVYLVFRKDYDEHKENPYELLDANKSYIVGAGINTKDYEERVPALVAAGADVLVIDSSDGYSEWQRETIQYVKSNFKVKIGAGNIVDREGFLYLVESGADFIKVGIGGGSICITREQKGIGRGQASSLIEVAAARDEYYRETGIYIPICSDGGIVHDYHITLSLAMGADFVMMGRYFARFDESPTRKLKIGNNFVKEFWGEGSNRARNWQRYDTGGKQGLVFEEGVDSYVPYAGSLQENLDKTLHKIKSTMCNCGSLSIAELQQNARITLVSATSIVEGGAHDVILKENSITGE
ncbi:inosine 5-monophosphate dehydrogenase [Paenibacillus baekrokdamisoli]|uniref:Inosine 5-monophosphate dehydrogenase n=1 Tax=Paenibacillus baekrokdamisoli TaxID=1712516 RepID=A0A3G9J208_9BACL|nr:IMP dehydrogenase [Paenibacillus baekrokdamisoli]MBB3072213.1 IMP dehydrogenase [Paenibacillus baekrokdamisoli]BBH24796.1 inosine 5-monophosphate dehydrogenase [Paenibacillus baekrokdamisoli]